MDLARTVFFGSGSFALPILERLLGPRPSDQACAEVVAVVTAPPRPTGRGGAVRGTPLADLADGLHLPLLTPATLRDEAVVTALRATAVELIVLADYGRIVPSAVLELPAHGALNLHPSLLPRHRGASPIPAAILAADARTGVTLMRMDEGLDSGPILAQRELPLGGDETAPELEAKLAELAADLLAETLPAWLDGSLPERAQPNDGVTLTRPLHRTDGRLDPARSAEDLERQVRAYQPWPGSFIEAETGRLIVWRAEVIPAADSVTPGMLVPVADSLALTTESGWLRLDEVQPAGRRRMSGAEYRRGLRA